ncbi:hypothetical protein C0J52_25765 [Blattella germanica]|nr:hypothetical protein C0J52_25765 [Blattella germanica]
MRHLRCQRDVELHAITPCPAAVIKPLLVQGQDYIGGCCHPTPGSQAEDEASFSSYRLQPPSGFSDSRELSEAECDRDNTLHLDKLLARFQQQKEQERLQFTIHV